MLKKYKIRNIELEIASANDYILKALNMGYNIKDIKKATKKHSDLFYFSI